MSDEYFQAATNVDHQVLEAPAPVQLTQLINLFTFIYSHVIKLYPQEVLLRLLKKPNLQLLVWLKLLKKPNLQLFLKVLMMTIMILKLHTWTMIYFFAPLSKIVVPSNVHSVNQPQEHFENVG